MRWDRIHIAADLHHIENMAAAVAAVEVRMHHTAVVQAAGHIDYTFPALSHGGTVVAVADHMGCHVGKVVHLADSAYPSKNPT